MSTRQIQYLRLDEVQPAPRNPKRHADEEIDASLERFGYVEPVLLDERTDRLVAGHGRLSRLRAKQEAGEDPPDGIDVDEDGTWRLPVVTGWSSKDDDEAEAYLIASNQLTTRGGWDSRDLADVLGDLAQRGPLEGTGFERNDLDSLLASIAPKAEPEPPAGFPGYGDDIETEHQCPRCGYQWSGKA